MQKKGEKDLKSMERSIQISQEQYNKKIVNIDKLVKLWRANYAKKSKQESCTSTSLQYAQYKEEFDNIDVLRGYSNIKPIKFEEQINYAQSQKEIILGSLLFDQKAWRISFSKIFIQKNKFFHKLLYSDEIFSKIYLFSQGFMNFNSNKPNSFNLLQKSRKSGLKYYTIDIRVDHQIYYVLASIGAHRIPQYNLYSGNNAKVELFHHIMVITFEDIILGETIANKKQMRKILNDLEQFYENNPRVNFKQQELVLDEALMNEKKVYFHSHKRDNAQQGAKIYPTIFKIGALSQLIIQDYQFHAEKFIEYQIRTQFIKNRELKQFQGSEELINELQQKSAENQNIQFRSHRDIIKNLQQIPNFKYALTDQQRRIISLQGNLIVVGRSGTGKTTCAMLRLYGIEFVLKLDEFNNLRKIGRIKPKSEKCLMDTLNQMKLMKNVFLTFSGMLITQIKKQYDDMTLQIRKKHAQLCFNCFQQLQQNKSQNIEIEDPLDQLIKQNQKQEQQVVPLHEIRMKDFPGFFTIENFIRIIDKTISRPFFSQQKEHKKPDRDNIVIKYAYINRYQYGFDSVKITSTQKAVRVDYQLFVKKIWNTLPKNLTKHSKELRLLTPSIVWSQICSIIKGSLNAYQCPGGFISLKMYIEDHQSIFQTEQNLQQYKIMVYKIFKSYMDWCKQQRNAYDLMDVVNHLLKQIEFYGYQGPKINFMFIDQVQDLTSSTILLISKMVINNIFYCGDSAQAITKGIIFRFNNLKLIFNKQYFKNALELQYPQDIVYLTVNFRSHNLILQLANSVIMTIQSLFPSSINKVKKERSDLFGPSPFVLINQSISTLLDLICTRNDKKQKEDHQNQAYHIKEKQKKEQKRKTESQKLLYREQDQDRSDLDDNQSDGLQCDQQERILNSEQVIIVRNKAEIRKLPKCLRKGIILIPQTSKGLQFDQIILYNFFSSCPIFDKWNNLLQHLQPDFIWQDQKEFQLELNRRAKEEKMESVPLTLQAKLFLGYDTDKRCYKVWGLKAKNSLKQISINLYYELATQLKILYTAVTRARSVFVIYDEKIPRNLLKIWTELDLIKFVDPYNIEQYYKIIHQYVHITEKHDKYISKQLLWFKAGKKCLARQDLENAKRCFANINRYDLVDRIVARQKAAKAENQLYRIDNQYSKIGNLGRDDKKIAKFKLQRRKSKAFQLFKEAAQLNQKHNRQKEAAELYFKAQDFYLALQCYKKCGTIDKMGQCYKNLNLNNEAIPIFIRLNDIESLISCYIQQKDWLELSFMLIRNYKQVSERIGKAELQTVKNSCLRQVLSNTISCSRVQEKEQRFKQFYGLSFQNNIQNKRILNKKQVSNQISKFVLEYQFNDFKQLLVQLQDKLKTLTQHEQKQHDYKMQFSMICQNQDITNDRINAYDVKIKRNFRSIDLAKKELLRLQIKYTSDELQNNQDYHYKLNTWKKLNEESKGLQLKLKDVINDFNSINANHQKVKQKLEQFQQVQ